MDNIKWEQPNGNYKATSDSRILRNENVSNNSKVIVYYANNLDSKEKKTGYIYYEQEEGDCAFKKIIEACDFYEKNNKWPDEL